MTLFELEIAALPPAQQSHYRKCIANGTAPQMALMFASGHSPIMRGSDRTFNEGARHKMSRIPAVNQVMFDVARKAGINTNGKYHCSCLGGYGDHMAWVSTIEDVREVIKKKGLNATGLVNYQAPEKPPQPEVLLAPDIVDAEVSKRLSQAARSRGLPKSPKHLASTVAGLREQVVAEHGRSPRKSGPAGSLGERVLACIAENGPPQ